MAARAVRPVDHHAFEDGARLGVLLVVQVGEAELAPDLGHVGGEFPVVAGAHRRQARFGLIVFLLPDVDQCDQQLGVFGLARAGRGLAISRALAALPPAMPGTTR